MTLLRRAACDGRLLWPQGPILKLSPSVIDCKKCLPLVQATQVASQRVQTVKLGLRKELLSNGKLVIST